MVVLELFLLGLAAAGVYLTGQSLLSGYRVYHRSRIAGAADPVRPADASPGDTDVVGRAVTDRPASLPIGDGECVASSLTVFVGENEADPFPFEDETRAVPFRVEADGGSVAVDHEDVTLETTVDAQRTESTYLFLGDLSEDVRAFLEDAGVPVPTSGKVSIDQRHVPVDQPVWVHGEIERRDGDMVVTGDGDGGPLVADAHPEEFGPRRNARFRSAVRDTVAFGALTVVVGGAGLVAVVL